MAARTALITGYPAPRARCIVEAVAHAEPDLTLLSLVHPERIEEAEQRRAALGPDMAARLTLLAGDPAAMDFGLRGSDYLDLAQRVDVVHAAYSITDPAASSETCERVNVGAARELVELGSASARSPLIVLYSSVFVSGSRSGRVLEAELQAGQSFRNPCERTLAVAERVLQGSGLRTLVLRAGHLLGPRQTGEVEHLSGPYPLVALLISLTEDRAVPLPPGADAVVPLTPIDHLAEVGAFGARAGLAGRAIHVLSEERPTLRAFLTLCAERTGRRLDSGFHPTALTRALLGNPVARVLPQSARSILEVLTTSADYDTRNMKELTSAGAPASAPLESYVSTLVEHVRARVQDGTLLNDRSSAAWLVA